MKQKSLYFGIGIAFVGGLALLGFVSRGSSGGATSVAHGQLPTRAATSAAKPDIPTPSDDSVTGHDDAQVKAPDFTFETLEGKTISLSNYRGVKPVVLDFWASWCHNCQRAMPKTQKLYEQYGEEVEIIGINLKETIGSANRFIDRHNITFPNGIDGGAIANAYGVRYTNTHFLIDQDGNLVDQFSGDLNEGHIQSLIGE